MTNASYKLVSRLCLVAAVLLLPQVASAHRSGCHNLHTCPSDTNTYACGDLGYPCNGATSVKDITVTAIQVPLVIEKAFRDTFGRTPSETESHYWKKRFRADKDGLYKLRRTMAWYKTQNSFGPKVQASATSSHLVTGMNDFFHSVYGRIPTESENRYWLSRIKDKPSEAALKGAMGHHRANNILH